MYGVTFLLSDLSAAKLNFADLQGTQFAAARFEGARLQASFFWRSWPPYPLIDAAVQPWVRIPAFDQTYRSNRFVPCKEIVGNACPWTNETFEALKQSLQDGISDVRRRNDALKRISGLDPTVSEPESRRPSVWEELEHKAPTEADFLKTRAKHLRRACCRDGGIYVLHALLKRRFDNILLEDRDVLKEFAGDLLDGKDCPEMNKLSAQDRALLERVRTSTAPFAP